MPVSEAQYLAYLRRVNALTDATQAAFRKLWPKLDHSSMDALKADLGRYYPALIDEYGRAMSVLTAEWYGMSRDATTPYEPITARGDTGKTANKAINYVSSDSFSGDMAAFLEGAIIQGVMDYQRATITENVKRDPWAKGYVSIARPNACAFCQIKAIASYRNYQGKKLDFVVNGNAWHPDCRCTLQPVGATVPDWVVPDAAERMYDAATAELRAQGIHTRGIHDTLPMMRKLYGIK